MSERLFGGLKHSREEKHQMDAEFKQKILLAAWLKGRIEVDFLRSELYKIYPETKLGLQEFSDKIRPIL